MADGSSWLKRASAESIVEAVRESGSIAFLCGGLTDSDIASCAANAIQTLDDENIELTMFFASSLRNDDRYASISYEIHDPNPAYRFVHLLKRIMYDRFQTEPIPDKVIVGPLMDRKKAQRIIDMLNEVTDEERK